MTIKKIRVQYIIPSFVLVNVNGIVRIIVKYKKRALATSQCSFIIFLSEIKTRVDTRIVQQISR